MSTTCIIHVYIAADEEYHLGGSSFALDLYAPCFHMLRLFPQCLGSLFRRNFSIIRLVCEAFRHSTTLLPTTPISVGPRSLSPFLLSSPCLHFTFLVFFSGTVILCMAELRKREHCQISPLILLMLHESAIIE